MSTCLRLFSLKLLVNFHWFQVSILFLEHDWTEFLWSLLFSTIQSCCGLPTLFKSDFPLFTSSKVEWIKYLIPLITWNTKGTSRGWQVADKKKTTTTKTILLPCFLWSETIKDKTWIRSMEATWRQRLARNKRKRAEKKATGEICSSRVKARKIQKTGNRREIALYWKKEG